MGKGTIRGKIKCPWGTVVHATITAGNKSVVSDASGKYEIPDIDAESARSM